MTPAPAAALGEISEGKYFAARLLENFHPSVYFPSSSAEPWQVWAGLDSVHQMENSPQKTQKNATI